jgi:hypothetical protein
MSRRCFVVSLIALLSPMAAHAGSTTRPTTAPAHGFAFHSTDQILDTISGYVGRQLMNLREPELRAANAALQRRVLGHRAFLEFRPLSQDQPAKGRFRIHAEDNSDLPVRYNIYYRDGIYEGEPKDYVANPTVAWGVYGWAVGTVGRCEIVADQAGNGVLTIDLTAEPEHFRQE